MPYSPLRYLYELPAEELRRLFDAPLPSGFSEDEYYPEVALALREADPLAIEWLLAKVPEVDEERRARAILLALTFPPPDTRPETRATLLRYLEDDRPLVVAEAVDGLAV